MSQSATFHGQQRQKPSFLSLDPARSKYPFLESLFGAPVCVFTWRVILMLRHLPMILFLFGVVFWLMHVVGFGWTWSESIKVWSFGEGQVFLGLAFVLFVWSWSFVFLLQLLVGLGGFTFVRYRVGFCWRIEVVWRWIMKRRFFFFSWGCLSVMKRLEGDFVLWWYEKHIKHLNGNSKTYG